MKKKLKSVKGVKLDTSVTCQRVYPVPNTKKTIKDLDTVAFKLTQEQGIELARNLLVATKGWKEIKVTGRRLKIRKDGTSYITVTGYD
jgi:hypothetical protein